MDLLAPLGPVYQAGTLSGNPVALAAGVATLAAGGRRRLRAGRPVAVACARPWRTALAGQGSPRHVSRAGNLFSIAFRDGAVRDYDDAKVQEHWRYPAFFHAMLEPGVSLPPWAFEAWFVSAAHTDTELDRIVAALPAAVRASADAPRPEPAD